MSWTNFSLFKAILLFVIGLLIAKSLSKTISKFSSKYATSQQAMLLRKATYFIIFALFIVAALQELGFKLSVLLGSAGIATAAIAFASQTSISNIISGIFLILEKSFQVGDTIKIDNTTGAIISIDLLSVKILTPDNTLVRIPNEIIIKSQITNVTRFTHRRIDIFISVAYKEDLKKAKELLFTLAKEHPLALKQPLPTVIIRDFTSSGVNLELSVWSIHKNVNELKDTLQETIKNAFQTHQIDMFSQQTIQILQ